MRVVRIVTRLNRGGPLRQIEALVPALARLGIDGPVWAGETEPHESDAAASLEAAGVEVVRVPGLARGLDPARDARAWRWIRRRLAAERPDVVHTHTAKAGALGRTAAASAGVACRVHTFHGHHLDAGLVPRWGTRVAERALSALTSAAVCLSPRQRRDLVERFGVVPASRAAVIGPGLDVLRLRASVDADAAARLRATHAPLGEALVLWLARLVPVKDPLTFVDAAAAALRFSGARARAVLVGGGPMRREVERRVAASGAAHLVDVVGEVADPATWIAASDAVVLSSTSEGTPLALLEAQALARPVVATAVGGVPDVVEDGSTGLLVPPRDASALAVAIARLVSDPALRARLAARAASEAPVRFGAERLARETAALYDRLRAGLPVVPDGPTRGGPGYDRARGR